MGAIGIVAEYNPFHNGHGYHLEESRRLYGGDAPVVAALSGDFVQRGAPAVFSKFARAEAAVRCGVSLVLELPLPWSLSSAEGFARGAVGLLAATGVVDALSFGCERGDAESLRAAAQALSRPELHELLRRELERGVSYAAARERALLTLAGEGAAALLRSPNDLLAVEYMKALDAGELPLRPLAVRRAGSRHDGEGSASALRLALAGGEDIVGLVPAEAMAVYDRELAAGRGPVLPESLRLPLLSRLRALPPSAYAALPDAAEGLENRLRAAAGRCLSLEELSERVKTKRYALSRLRRMAYCAALGVTADMAAGAPPYIRVLAMDDRGRALLRDMRRTASLPVVVKPARARLGNERAAALFALTASAHDLYVLGFSQRETQRGGGDLRATPYVFSPRSGEKKVAFRAESL